MDPSERPWCSQLLKHEFFKKDNFGEKFAQELKAKITRETADNPLLKSIVGRHGDTKDDTAEEKARRKKRREKVDFVIYCQKRHVTTRWNTCFLCIKELKHVHFSAKILCFPFNLILTLLLIALLPGYISLKFGKNHQ